MVVNYLGILTYILEIIVFLILMVIFKFVFNQIKSRSYKLLNPTEYLPEEEVHTLKQVFYLTMMALCFINALYILVFLTSDIIYFVIFDILFSLYIATTLDKSTWKNRILLLLLIPYGSLTFILFNNSLFNIMSVIHAPVFLYFIKEYYYKFEEYTKSNGLGIAVLLLFLIIFISFFITQIVENVNPVDSIVMVSNAFTSNGYAVLGSSLLGKITSIFLVWGGYVLSGVGTATLTAAILKKHYDMKNSDLNDKIDKMDEKIDRLEEIIKNK